MLGLIHYLFDMVSKTVATIRTCWPRKSLSFYRKPRLNFYIILSLLYNLFVSGSISKKYFRSIDSLLVRLNFYVECRNMSQDIARYHVLPRCITIPQIISTFPFSNQAVIREMYFVIFTIEDNTFYNDQTLSGFSCLLNFVASRPF